MTRARNLSRLSGLEAFTVDSSTNYVGLASVTPDSKLDVIGDANISGVVTATTFIGDFTGDVTGDVTGNLTGDVTGDVTGNLTGDVNAGIVTATSRIAVGSATTTAQLYVVGNSASNIVAVGTATTITVDFTTGNNFTITLDGNYTLGNPTGVTTGQSGSIFLVQDGTGSRTLGFGTHWHFAGGAAPTLTTTANAVDVLVYQCRTATSIPSNTLLDVQ